jgi:hypothetical protein
MAKLGVLTRVPRRVLLAAMLLGGAVLSVVHLRAKISAIHDSGFSPVSLTRAAGDLPGRKTNVVIADGQFMTLDPTGRFLINSITRTPVFITGDSAWSLITQLDNPEVEAYLSDRASRGFNYIWCAAADNYYQSHPPENYYRYPPFDGPDFTQEDPNYWAHVDYVIERAAAHGITVALNPGFVGLSAPFGYLVSYENSSEDILSAYGAFLGKRYKGYPNIIWALGGDVDPETGVLPKITALAEGIHSQDKIHLMVAEGQPQHAALDTYGPVTWMDLNWLYFHTTNIPDGTAGNYTRSPWLPPFLGEGWYENEHTPPLAGLEYREQGYWAVLSGSYLGNGGFGNSPIWYFNAGPEAKTQDPSWQGQLGSEGSVGQMYLGKLFRSREHWKLVPDISHTVITSGYDSRSVSSSTWESLRSVVRREPYRLGSASSVAARTSDGQTIIAYVPNGNVASITVAMNEIKDAGSQAKCWWFNPRDGSSILIGDFSTRGPRKFTPPDAKDWILVVDSQRAHLPPPGSASLSFLRQGAEGADDPVSDLSALNVRNIGWDEAIAGLR